MFPSFTNCNCQNLLALKINHQMILLGMSFLLTTVVSSLLLDPYISTLRAWVAFFGSFNRTFGYVNYNNFKLGVLTKGFTRWETELPRFD